MRKQIILFLALFCASIAQGITYFSYQECQGSLRPYPVPTQSYSYPDSLTPIFINHIGRHGSRYAASASWTLQMRDALAQADSLKTITPLGKKFQKEVEKVIKATGDRWGALDSLGMAEQSGIAERMFANFPQLLQKGNINAIATYSPRVIMSMYTFTHSLAQLSSNININASSGKRFSPLLCFFDDNEDYIHFRSGKECKDAYKKFLDETCPTAPIEKLLGVKYPFNPELKKDLAMSEYYIIAGMKSMGINFDPAPYLSLEEYNKLWSIFNFRQYIQRTHSTLSSVPANISAPLLENIISTADSVLSGKLNIVAQLRFAHAETLMPLFSLLNLPHCNYLTNYFDTVQYHWADWYVVPMASNLQIIYFKATGSGNIYVRFDLNETPISLSSEDSTKYYPWDKAREYMIDCLGTN